MSIQEKIGCESYLYKEIRCCLHNCSANMCPEVICAIEFPGGINSYLRYKTLREALLSGMDINEAADYLKISRQKARFLFNKGHKVLK
jgi:hypothetical protein